MTDPRNPSAPDPDRTARTRTPYVLVAEPDQRRAAMYRDLLQARGYEVVVSRNGDEAKLMLKRRELPSLVVANLSLPRLDGFALLAELNKASGTTSPPVLVISSSKELTGAAWNLKERLGVTELLATDADEVTVSDTLGRLVPLREDRSDAPAAGSAAPSPAHERWIADTLDRDKCSSICCYYFRIERVVSWRGKTVVSWSPKTFFTGANIRSLSSHLAQARR